MVGVGNKPAPSGNFNQRNTFLDRAAGDREEVLSVGLGESPIAFRQLVATDSAARLS